MVKDLGGRAFLIPGAMKPLYHVACVFAAGYMAVFLDAIRSLAIHLPLPVSWTEVFGPLMTTAIGNAMTMHRGEALTGPVIRRDIGTVETHLRALSERAPELLPLYTIMGLEVARIARLHGRIDDEMFSSMLRLFRASIRNPNGRTTKPRKR
jgi:predicted short-subunit dehydrogenase-like oxidoreductase (DUF2520 family)